MVDDSLDSDWKSSQSDMCGSLVGAATKDTSTRKPWREQTTCSETNAHQEDRRDKIALRSPVDKKNLKKWSDFLESFPCIVLDKVFV